MKTKLKTYVAAMAMLFMPLAISAQTDGFFSSDNGGGSRGYFVTVDDDGGAIVHTHQFQGVPKDAPLGSGLLIMVAAGAGYLALKRKEDK